MKAEVALERAQLSGVPTESLALYGRWWQLEVWLRQLSYLVLRAAWGSTWETEINKRAASYAGNDDLVHLAAPDQSDLLGYLDFALLLRLIEDNWTLFEPFLLQHPVWVGRAVEMRSIRNRVGHVRRAGQRDRDRVEQLLADLEPGFRRALKTISTQAADSRSADPVVAAYRGGHLRMASDHLRRRYRLDVELEYSTMPWADVPPSPSGLTGTAGVLWHLSIGGPDRIVDPGRLAELIQPVRESVVFVFAGTFGAQMAVPAVDEGEPILQSLVHFAEGYPSCTTSLEKVRTEDAEQWPGDVSSVDSRVLVDHLFAIAPSSDVPGTVFGV